MTIKVVNNFLNEKNFNYLTSYILDSEFPWRKRDKTTPEDKNNNIYFSYSFFNELKVNSELYSPLILPILKKLNVIAPIQVRSNMVINKLMKDPSWHTDYRTKSKTAILYLNTCEGGTEFKINKKVKFVKAESNKIVIFNSNVEHRGIYKNDVPYRYILNLNYYDYSC